MAELKTKPTKVKVSDFIDAIADEGVRKDCKSLAKMMKGATGVSPKMWGPSIVGFGSYHYKYDSGHEGDSCMVGFAPRGKQVVLYIMPELLRDEKLLAKLGKHKTGKSCLYIKRLEDVDTAVLGQIIDTSVKRMKATYPRA